MTNFDSSRTEILKYHVDTYGATLFLIHPVDFIFHKRRCRATFYAHLTDAEELNKKNSGNQSCILIFKLEKYIEINLITGEILLLIELRHTHTLPPPLDCGWCGTAGSLVLHAGFLHLQPPVRLHLLPSKPASPLVAFFSSRIGPTLA